MRLSSRLIVLLTALLLTSSFIPSSARADDVEPKPRIKFVIANADRVMGDLEWIVAKLAQEEGQWNNNLKDILETFLFGVDREEPIRFDALIGGEDPGAVNPSSYRLQPCIPIEKNGKGVKKFIDENLVPVGINVRQRTRGGYYELSGAYEGWMRMVENYGCIGTYESDVPKGMPHPKESHEELLEKGYDIALELDNQAEQSQMRTEAFEVVQQNLVDATKQKEGESEAAFAQRKGSVERQLEKLRSLFVEARRITIGWTTDVEQESGRADMYGEGLPDTDLAKFIGMISTEPSRFASVEMPEDPALSFRVNLPFGDLWKRHLKEGYDLARPVAHEKIDANEQITTSEKEPAKKASDLLFDMLTEGIELGRIDLFIDMTKAEEGQHRAVFAVRAKDGKKADEIVKLIPEAHKAWKAEMDVETVAETAIHKIDISEDLPKALSDTFGESGAIYVATSKDLVWIAGGDGSLELLKETITRVSEAETPTETSPVFGEFKLHAHTLLALYDSLVTEMGWTPLGTIDVQSKGPKSKEGGQGLQPIDPAEMRGIAVRATADIDDHMSGEARRIDNHAEGEIVVAPGVLRAVGKIIAKIGADNL